jgi:hypothetical protein
MASSRNRGKQSTKAKLLFSARSWQVVTSIGQPRLAPYHHEFKV